MAAEIHIQYTCKTGETCSNISHIGGILNGRKWKITHDDAIRGVENKTYSFYVMLKGKVVDVYIATAKAGFKYLRTRADNERIQHLLTLPECPDTGIVTA